MRGRKADRRARDGDARQGGRLRDGHRRERDAGRPRTSIRTRKRRALKDLGVYRCVAFRDLATERFGGHPYAARRAVDQLKRQGLVAEWQARGPKGSPFRLLHLTEAGRRSVEAAPGQGLDPRQRYWSGRAKAREAAHDAAVYRAGQRERRRLAENGCRVTRIRCDSELKSAVARAAEKARSREGAAAAQRAKEEAARQLGLPIVEGKVLHPDLQIEYVDAGGRAGRVNVEVTTSHYGKGELRAKASAGFRMHAADGRARSNLESALRSQYARFLRDGRAGSRVRSQRLVDALTGRGFARDAQLPGIGRVCLLHSKTVYRVLRAPHIRHRREAGRGTMLRRLLSLDCVVGREGRHWLPTEPEKVAAFAALGIERGILPKRVYGRSGGGRTVRYFGWKMPVAVDARTALFVYVDAEGETYAELLSWGAEHARLWSALKERGIRVEAAVASASVERLAGARPVLDRWLSRGLGKASGLAPAERAELRLLERAASALDLVQLERLGGFQAALERITRLRRKAAGGGDGAAYVRIDAARMWRSDLAGAGASP